MNVGNSGTHGEDIQSTGRCKTLLRDIQDIDHSTELLLSCLLWEYEFVQLEHSQRPETLGSGIQLQQSTKYV